MLKWEDDSYNDATCEDIEYYELLEAAKCIIDSMTGITEGMMTVSEIEGSSLGTSMGWTNEYCDLEINEIIPESDTFYLTAYVPVIGNSSSKDPLIYMYKIEDEYIERELLFSSSAAPVIDAGRKVLDELIFVLKGLLA